MVNSHERVIAIRLPAIAWTTVYLLFNLMHKCIDGFWIVSTNFDCLNDEHSDTGLQQGTIIIIDRE